jgi:phosphate transport system protein
MTDVQASVKVSASLDRELVNLQKKVLVMGKRVDETIVSSIQALREQDDKLAQRIIKDDSIVNAMRYEVEEKGLSIIARQQPAARDLREVLAALSIVTDLERMGDHAAGIAKTVLLLEESPTRTLPVGLVHMSDLIRGMLRRTLEAYMQHDADLAYSVALQDDLIDTQYRVLFKEILGSMIDTPASTDILLYYLFSGHNLERIADRITNIAERVVFTSSGEMTELNPEKGVIGLM